MTVWCSDGLLVWSRRRGEKKEYGAKYLGNKLFLFRHWTLDISLRRRRKRRKENVAGYLGNKLCLFRHWTLNISQGLSEEGGREGKEMLLGIWAISFACLDIGH